MNPLHIATTRMKRFIFIQLVHNMNSLTEKIVVTRRLVCPRTSYATSGYAASTLFSFVTSEEESKELMTLVEAVHSSLLNSKEFDHFEIFQDWERLQSSIVGHVVVCFLSSLQQLQPVTMNLLDLLRKDSNKLFFIFVPTFVTSKRNILRDMNINTHDLKITEESYDSLGTLLCVHKNNTFNRSFLTEKIDYHSLPVGFNGQPAVHSRCQFRYLWGMLPHFNHRNDFPTKLEQQQQAENKQRVLQRLAGQACANGRKYPATYWDELITKLLVQQNADDWTIYSTLREQYCGHTIEYDIDHPPTTLMTNSSGGSGGGGGGGGGEEEDGRAEYFVKCILDCLPSEYRDNLPKYIHNVLDYGCAEGAITASLGQGLQLRKESIFGADVRAITAHDFHFIQLPREEADKDENKGEGEGEEEEEAIFPMFATGSIDLINASMVFHHVTRIDRVLRELRRILAPHGHLIVREHDCPHAASGIFLDIVHGLYSLAWQQPIEWPDFITEYAAYYRQREDWTALFQRHGFELATNQHGYHYNAAIGSTWNAKNQKFKNVTRAYYAVYTAKADYVVKIPKGLTMMVKEKEKKVGSVLGGNVMKRKQMEETNLQELMNNRDMIVYESKHHPGKFYAFNKSTGTAEWIQ